MSGIGYLRFVADVFGVGTNDRAARKCAHPADTRRDGGRRAFAA